MSAGNAYPSGHLVPSPIVGLACAPIVETRFLELAMSLLDFSPRILHGTFSILLLERIPMYHHFAKSMIQYLQYPIGEPILNGGYIFQTVLR